MLGCDPSAMGNRARTIVYRVVGDPPTGESSREQRLRWIRRFYARWSLPILAVLALVIGAFGAPTWLWVALGFCTAFTLWGLLRISRQIQRERKPPTG